MFKVVLVEAESTAMAKNLRVRAMLEGGGFKKLAHGTVKPFHVRTRHALEDARPLPMLCGDSSAPWTQASYNELYVRPDLLASNDPRPSQHPRLYPRAMHAARFLDGMLAAPDVWRQSRGTRAFA